MRGKKIKGIGGSSRGTYIRSIADIQKLCEILLGFFLKEKDCNGFGSRLKRIKHNLNILWRSLVIIWESKKNISYRK